MADLRALLESLGYEDVRTHLQSGNAVLSTGAITAAKLEQQLESSIAAELGVACKVLVRTGPQMAAVVEHNPFIAKGRDPKELHVAFLSSSPTAEKRADGAVAHGVVCDVTSLEQMDALARRAFELLGGVHVVFNNAGVAVAGPVAEMSHDEWRWVIDVDLWGPIHGVEAFVPRLIEQGQGGHVLFTASFAGLVPNIGLGPYCVAKYGVVALAEVLSRELRPHGIGVSVLCPMRVATNIGASERNRSEVYGGPRAAVAVPEQDESNNDLA